MRDGLRSLKEKEYEIDAFANNRRPAVFSMQENFGTIHETPNFNQIGNGQSLDLKSFNDDGMPRQRFNSNDSLENNVDRSPRMAQQNEFSV